MKPCDGCSTKSLCMKAYGKLIWVISKKCPCRNCLIKTTCNDSCKEMVNYLNADIGSLLFAYRRKEYYAKNK